ncbi:C1 family peptidase [Bacteriovorax sp. PP10]|uniref:C1 family peptidase n=1 Tax=Bacteriovorax antarcticus TaxID=3088717 RepID=A0ABU5VXP8_9BACT|nr:C1 family peptidase [Bacteriovorax sp. PP10]MEA9357835.1 C1 family peptidase [Bacteriovorax sp. PP10]
MRHGLNVSLLLSVLIITGCGGKKSSAPKQMSEAYKLDNYYAVENPSTLDYEKIKQLPETVDLKDMMTPVKDQDERGTCSFFAGISLVESAIKSKMNVEVNLSEEYLNYALKSKRKATGEGAWPEQSLFQAIDNKAGFLLERDWPYQPLWFGIKAPCIDVKMDNKAPSECYSHNSPPEDILAKKISGENFELEYNSEITTTDIIGSLALNKKPMAIVVPVNAKGWKDDGTVSYTQELKQECINDGSKCGTHVIVLTGYDIPKKVFFFRNSWNKKWGKDGYGEIPFDVIDRNAELAVTIVTLKSDITLPADHAKNYLELENFKVSSKEEKDQSVTIKTSALIRNSGANTIKYGSSLMEVAPGVTGEINDKNTEYFEMSDEDHKLYDVWGVSNGTFIFADLKTLDKTWSFDEGETYVAATNLMTSTSVKKSSRLYFRTSLYMYTDDQKYKVLKRYFHPFNYN